MRVRVLLYITRVVIPLLALTLGLAPAAYAQSSAYTVTEVKTPSDAGSVGRGINGAGHVVGRLGTLQALGMRAFLWKGAGDLTAVPVAGPSEYSAGAAINDAGEVVGTMIVADSIQAFSTPPLGTNRVLGALPGDTSSQAFGINASGDIVGYSSGPQGMRACIWRSGGGAQELQGLHGNSSVAFDVNDSGVVVGYRTTSSGTHAFRWTPEQGVRDLPTLPGFTSSRALALNNDGVIVGYLDGPNGMRAFAWSSEGGMRDLGTLPNGHLSRALDVSNSGVIVGASAVGHHLRAFIWTPQGGMKDLNLLIVETASPLQEAHAINARGQILVLGTDPGQGEHEEDSHEGPTRLFVLTPSGGTTN